MEVDLNEFLSDVFGDTDSVSANRNTNGLFTSQSQSHELGFKLDSNQISFDDLDFSEDFWKSFILEEEPKDFNGSVSSDVSDHTYDRDSSLSPGSDFHLTTSPESDESPQEFINEEFTEPVTTVQYSVILDNVAPGEIGAQEVVLTSDVIISENFEIASMEEEEEEDLSLSSNDDASSDPFSGIYAEMNYCKVQKQKCRTQGVYLSEEEKSLMKKEGISVPTHLPLTKQEERDIKRIRRKIRNKQSAQDSRKRKKEYIDGLENRVRICTTQNVFLQKKVKVLEKQNSDLMTQLKQLKAILTATSVKPTKTSTCAMVFLLSFALLLMPNFRPGTWDNDISPAVGPKNTPVPGHSRNLLFAVESEAYDQQESVESVEDKANQSLSWDLSYLQKEISKITQDYSHIDYKEEDTKKTIVFHIAENH